MCKIYNRGDNVVKSRSYASLQQKVVLKLSTVTYALCEIETAWGMERDLLHE